MYIVRAVPNRYNPHLDYAEMHFYGPFQFESEAVEVQQYIDNGPYWEAYIETLETF